MLYLIVFLLTFVFSYIIYYMISLRPELNRIEFYEGRDRAKGRKESERRQKRQAKKKIKYDQKKLPSEIAFVVYRYHLDVESKHYRKFLLAMGVVTAFDLAVAVTSASVFDSVFFQVVIGLVVLLILALLTYHLIGTYFQKKGMRKDGTNQ